MSRIRSLLTALVLCALVVPGAMACQTVGIVDQGSQVDFVVEGTTQGVTVELELRTLSRGASVEYYDGDAWVPMSAGATVQGTRVLVRDGTATVAWTSACGTSWGGGIVQPSDE